MVPNRDGHANHGHACVKGRFAYGYATHPDRITTPMIRKRSTIRGSEVSWDEAIGYAASEFRRIQAKYGRDSIGGITSSRCTNEETFLVQKLVRAAFGNNNVDTCARVCHSPTGYGLKNTLGESAGTQEFDSVHEGRRDHGHRREPDRGASGVRLADEAAAAAGREAHRHRSARDRAGADRRTSRRTTTCSCGRARTSPLINALAHVIVTEGLTKDDYIAERCERDSYEKWKEFVAEPIAIRPRAMETVTGVPAGTGPRRGAAVRDGGQRRHLLRPRRHGAQPGHRRW